MCNPYLQHSRLALKEQAVLRTRSTPSFTLSSGLACRVLLGRNQRKSATQLAPSVRLYGGDKRSRTTQSVTEENSCMLPPLVG